MVDQDLAMPALPKVALQGKQGEASTRPGGPLSYFSSLAG